MADMNDTFVRRNDDSDREIATEKRSFVIDELVKTEREYVRDLALVVNDYIEMIRDPIAVNCSILVPGDLKRLDVQNVIFSNIEQIYEWHKNVFLNEVERCFAEPQEIGQIFKKNVSTFTNMYIIYCQKNQMFESYMNEHRLYFEELRKFSCHVYPLRDLLIRPVKRIMTYTLLLRKKLEYSRRVGYDDEAEEIQQAIEVTERLINSIDGMMVVDRLRDFNGNVAAQGELLLHGEMRCAKHQPVAAGKKPRELAYKDFYVFLFERSVIFAVKKDKKKKFVAPFYVYKTHIPTNQMIVEESSSDYLPSDQTTGSFTIKSIDLDSPSPYFVCQVDSAILRSEWLKNLRDLAQVEHYFHPDITTSTI